MSSAVYSGEYVGFRQYGSRVSKFFEGADVSSLYGGFYNTPTAASPTTGRSLAEVYLEKVGRNQSTILNYEPNEGRGEASTREYADKLERSGINVIKAKTQYHAKAFRNKEGGVEQGFTGSGNISEDAVNHGLPTSAKLTYNNRIKLEVDNFIGSTVQNVYNAVTGSSGRYEGPRRALYEANVGVITTNPQHLRELKQIENQYRRTGKAESTDNFIVGGQSGDSSRLISEFIGKGGFQGSSIQIAAPYIDDPNIVKALVKAREAGAKVQVISADDKQSIIFKTSGGGAGHSQALAELIAGGVEVYTPGREQGLLIHAKAVRVNQELISGSHNLTVRAATNSMEISQRSNYGVEFGKDFNSLISEGFVHQMNADSLQGSMRKMVNAEGAIRKAREAGVTNEQFAPLFDESASMGYLLLPSKLGASYHYAVALHNNLMNQAGYQGMGRAGEGFMGIAEASYKIAMRADKNKAGESAPWIVQQYDRELYQGGWGNWLNENVFLPSGMGRLYKDELGFIPSLFGTAGAALDKGYLYYAAIAPDVSGTLGQDLNDTDLKNFERKSGLFESLFSTAANFGIQTSAAVALYLTVGEPINMLIGEMTRTEQDKVLEQVFKIQEPTTNMLRGQINLLDELSKVSRFGVVGHTLFSQQLYGNDLKLAMLNQVIDLKDQGKSFYDIDNFQTTVYHFNNVFFRQKAGILLENTIKPFLVDYINPFAEGTDGSKNFIQAVDDFITGVKSPPTIEAQYMGPKSHRSFNITHDIQIAGLGKTDTAVTIVPIQKNVIVTDERSISEFGKELNNSRKGHDKTVAELKKAIAQAQEHANDIRKVGVQANLGISLTEADQKVIDLQDALNKLTNERTLLTVERDSFLEQTRLIHANVGASRQTNVAMKLQKLLDVVPLNPFHWKLLGGVNQTKDYTAVGQIFSFDEASKYMKRILFSQEGIRQIIDENIVMEEVNGKMVTTLRSRAKTIRKVLDKGLGALVSHIVSGGERYKDFQRLTHNLRVAEKNLGYKQGISWDAFTGRTATIETAAAHNASDMFNALADYEDFMKSGGAKNANMVDIAASMNQRISAMGLTRVTQSNAAKVGSELLQDANKGKLGKVAAVGILGMLLLNDVFQSTGGVSIFTQLGLALQAGRDEAKLSVSFSDNKLTPFGAVETFTVAGAIGFGSYHMANQLRDYGTQAYSFTQDQIDKMATGTADSIWEMVDPTDPAKSRVYQLKHKASGRTIELTAELAGGLSREDIVQLGGADRLKVLNKTIGAKAARTQLMMEAVQHIAGKERLYVTKPVIQALNDRVFLTTTVLTTIGLLAYSGLRKAAAATLNTSRDTTGTLDPIIAGGIAGVIGGLMTKSPVLGVVTSAVAAGGMSILNKLGLQFFKVGGAGQELSIQAQSAAALNDFSAIVMHRNEKHLASEAELIAGFYAGEMAKHINVVETDRNERQVQVIARQVPLPFIQFFLAQSIEGQKWVNGRLMEDNASKYWTLGVQTGPMLGSSYSVQLPFRYKSGTGVAGFTYNQETNIVDVLQGSYHLLAVSGLALGFAKGVSNTGAGIFKSLGKQAFLGKLAPHFDEAAAGLEDVSRMISGADQIRGGFGRLTEAFTNVAYRISKNVPFIDNHMFKMIVDNSVGKTAPQALDAAATHTNSITAHMKANAGRVVARAGLGFIIGGIVSSIAYQLWADNENRPFSETEHSLAQTAGSIIGIGVYTVPAALTKGEFTGFGPGISKLVSDIADPFKAKVQKLTQSKIGQTFRAISSKPMFSPIINAVAGGDNALVHKLTSSRTRGIGTLAVLMAGVSYLLTDSNFGYGVNFDQRVKLVNGEAQYGPDGQPLYDTDPAQRITTMGLYTAVTTTYLTTYAKMGMDASTTLEAYERILDRRYRGVERAWWNPIARWSDKQIERDALTIIADAGNKFNNLLPVATGAVNEAEVNAVIRAKTLAQDIHNFANVHHVPTGEQQIRQAQHALSGLRDIETHTVAQNAIPDSRSMAQLYEASHTLRRSIAGKLFSSRLTRAGIGIAALNAVVFGLTTEGGENNKFLEWVLTNTDKSDVGLFRAAGDVIRLLSGRDIIDPGMVSGEGIMSGETIKLTGRKLVNPKDAGFRGAYRAYKDITSIFVFDNPNAFLPVLGPLGMSLRQGDEGVRSTFYFQLQSAGQDISTATYSAAAKYAFAQAARGDYELTLMLSKATASLAGKGKNGKTDYTDAQVKLASLKILNATAMVPQLRKRRKISQLSSGALDLIEGNSVLAAQVRDRNQLLAHLSWQPPESVISNMIRDAGMARRKDLSLWLPALMKGDPKAIESMFKDMFGNQMRDRALTNVRFFGYDYKNKGTTPVAIEDESEWIEQTAYTTDVFTKEQDKTLFSNAQYLWNIIPPGIPRTLAGLAGLAMLIPIAAIGLNAVRRMGYVQDVEIQMTKNRQFFDGQTFSRTLSNKPLIDPDMGEFYVRELTTPEGHEVKVSQGKTPATPSAGEAAEEALRRKANGKTAVIRKGGTIFELSSVALDNAPETSRKLQRMAQAFDNIFNETFGALDSATNKGTSFIKHISSQEFRDVMRGSYDAAINGIDKTAQRATFIAGVKKNYMDEINKALDAIYGTYDDKGIRTGEGVLHGKGGGLTLGELMVDTTDGKVDVYKLINPLYDPSMPEAAHDLWVWQKKEAIRKNIEETLTEGLEKFIKRSPTGQIGVDITENIVRGSLDSHFQRLTEVLVGRWVSKDKGKGFNLMAHTLGLLEATTDRKVNIFARIVENFSQNARPKAVPTPTTPTGPPQPTPHTTRTTHPIAEPTVRRPAGGNAGALITNPHVMGGRMPIMQGVFKSLNFIGLTMDILTSIDILSASSRLSREYVNPYSTTESLKQVKREYGQILANQLLFGTVIGVGSAGFMGMAGSIGTALGITAGIATFGLAALGIGILGIGAYVGYQNFIKPMIETTSLGKNLSVVGKTVNKVWEGTGDALGEVFGGWLPSIGKAVAGDRGAAAVTTMVGGAAAGLVTGVGVWLAGMMGAAAIGAGTVATAGLILPIVIAGAMLGLAGGALFPTQFGNFMESLTNALDKVPFLGALATTNKEVLEQERYQFNMGGNTFFYGTLKDAIHYDYKQQLEAAGDYTGKATARLMLSKSLYGSTPQLSVYDQAMLQGGAVKPNPIMTNTLSREWDIRGQLINQTVFGQYTWGIAKQNSSRESQKYVELMEKKWGQRRADALAEAIIKEGKKVSQPTPVLTKKPPISSEVDSTIALKLIEVSQNRANVAQKTKVRAKAPIHKVKNPTTDGLNHLTATTTGRLSIVKQKGVSITERKAEGGVHFQFGKVAGDDNELFTVGIAPEVAKALVNPTHQITLGGAQKLEREFIQQG